MDKYVLTELNTIIAKQIKLIDTKQSLEYIRSVFFESINSLLNECCFAHDTESSNHLEYVKTAGESWCSFGLFGWSGFINELSEQTPEVKELINIDVLNDNIEKGIYMKGIKLG